MRKTTIQKMSHYVILFCQNMGVSISPLKLQKLLYYIQSWHIARFGKETLFNELPEAWVNGPVYRTIYDIYKQRFFRSENIFINLDESELNKKLLETRKELALDESQMKLVDSVLNAYSKLSDERLVLMTHSEAPWNEAREGYSVIQRCTQELKIDTIYDYFNRING